MPEPVDFHQILQGDNVPRRDDPPPAFAFKVEFLRLPNSGGPLACSFSEVAGLEQTLETEELVEGGENRFVHQLPTRVKARRLTLKRGLVQRDSAFVDWCRQSLRGGMERPLQLVDVKVQLLDATLAPLRSWTCNGAFPVRWTMEPFASMKNEVAIEEIELAYRDCWDPE
ncbi:phage tail protein [Roseateles sp. So40a]|uniref:phage tail protein n=1 Tax=Roseateles sp. So40a TaxID=3400226 RepID=UPI003A8BB849